MLAVLLAASLAAPVPKSKGGELFYPTTVGAKRVLEVRQGNTTTVTVETVDAVEEKNGVYTVTVSGESARGATFEVSAKGLSRTGPQESDPTPLLNLAVREGESWECELQGSGAVPRKMKYTLGKREEVRVAAGKFRAVRVESETLGGGAVQKSTTWFAPGVGIVKREYDGGGALKFTMELKEFTPGK